MGKIKEREYTEYDEEEIMEEGGEGFADNTELDLEEDDEALLEDDVPQSRRTWRDTEKYKEMRELYKIINDDLYNGFDTDEFLEDEN